MRIQLGFLLIVLAFVSCMQRDRGNHSAHRKLTENVSDTSNILTGDNKTGTERHLPEISDRKKVIGTVVRIIDGDTFVLLLDNDFETGVRLNAIDCPEKKQAFSQRAKKELSTLIFNKQVTVYYRKKDGFGRVLGDVLVNGTKVNQEMLKRGMAWHYVKYSDDEALSMLEKEARKNKIGLWSEPNPIPPWEYRSK